MPIEPKKLTEKTLDDILKKFYTKEEYERYCSKNYCNEIVVLKKEPKLIKLTFPDVWDLVEEKNKDGVSTPKEEVE